MVAEEVTERTTSSNSLKLSAHRDVKQTFEYLDGPMKGKFKTAILVELYVKLGD